MLLNVYFILINIYIYLVIIKHTSTLNGFFAFIYHGNIVYR